MLLCGGLSPAPAQPADSLLQGQFWKAQGQAILSAWTQHAHASDGTLYAELDRTWTPTDSSTQYPGMLARHLYSYAAGYLLGGREAYLDDADAILEFLIEHGWDDTYGGWYNAVTRTGEVVDPNKDLFMQIYATTGLALYYIATRDARAGTYLTRSRRFMQEHAWDEAHGGYVDVLHRDGSVQASVKDFSPQLAPLSGYLLYLYPATGDSTYLPMIRARSASCGGTGTLAGVPPPTTMAHSNSRWLIPAPYPSKLGTTIDRRVLTGSARVTRSG
jgi:mannose/cellobiose epimerase-like protein (N-acyl-D-glucosamine 2-epimerase family)